MEHWEGFMSSKYSGIDLRKKLYEDFKDELLIGLNQDLITENEQLKSTIKHLTERRY